MRADIEDYFLNPPPGSAAARAAEFGIDLTLTLENLRLTPEERIRKLDNFIEDVANLKASVRIIGPTNGIADQDH
jgi:hypothetical protein